MTKDETLERLAALALMVALKAPQVRNQYVHDARVPWAIIEEIREMMAAAGIDYSAARKRFAEIEAAKTSRVRHVNPDEFKALLLGKRIRGASLDDVNGTHHKRALYRHPTTGQYYVSVE